MEFQKQIADIMSKPLFYETHIQVTNMVENNSYSVHIKAGKPPVGLHLDVLKGDKLIQKLMVDEKKCYLFGRNHQLNDFCIDHASCSRVHAALVYHKFLNRTFLIDLGSTHGTFIGNMRLESDKPTQLPVDSTFHFGASTRYYIIRERPQTGPRAVDEFEKTSEDLDTGGLLGLPETETELDNLTEFNTAHNRRISMLGIPDDEIHKCSRKRKKKGISFNEDEEVINPEDVDPSVGRFRNLIQTTVIPSKKMRMEGGLISPLEEIHGSLKNLCPTSLTSTFYPDLPQEQYSTISQSNLYTTGLTSLTSRLGIGFPNPAPEVEITSNPIENKLMQTTEPYCSMDNNSLEPKKKKYAKEAWPGKKPVPTLLV
ncbi:nuclear inhibitor of protein phosphatase 1 [Copidosoma floridanum]|uniref:nuclear inhibitor of protein phosphatase 1 n=1 Tax=Copidosoma floridanum TaxID=29053 RepID=UPI0006C9B353|nr:nuclear inhibitor of protein phosphatase 1 [Copidosoma floridanum]